MRDSTHRAADPVAGPDTRVEEDLARLERLATLLDSQFRIPGTEWRLGLDGLIGLIPGIGDVTTAAVSLYIVARAYHHGVPMGRLIHMLWNIAVDTLVGSIPVLGDIFDIGWKANRKNLDLLRAALAQRRI